MWVFLDLGRSLWKAALDFAVSVFIVGAVAPISPAQYKREQKRAGNASLDVMIIDGQAYAFGETARNYKTILPASNAQRYNRGFIGIAAIHMIVRLLTGRLSDGHEIDVTTMISHPPLDAPWIQDLIDALIGTYRVEFQSKEVIINIVDVYTEDEPVALSYSVKLTQTGEQRRRGGPDGDSITFDLGGITLDASAQRKNGEIIEAFTRSHEAGVIPLLTNLESIIKDKYSDNPDIRRMLQTTPYLPRTRLETALVTGYYVGGGAELNVVDEAQDIREGYFLEVETFSSTFPLAQFDWVNLGGGATGLFWDMVPQYISHMNVVPATDSPDNIQLAPVFGMIKEYRMWKKLGLI